MISGLDRIRRVMYLFSHNTKACLAIKKNIPENEGLLWAALVSK